MYNFNKYKKLFTYCKNNLSLIGRVKLNKENKNYNLLKKNIKLYWQKFKNNDEKCSNF